MALFVLAVNKGLCTTFRTVLVVMRLINKKSIHTQFFKCDHIILSALVVQLLQLGVNGLFRALHLLDGESLPNSP